MRPQLQQDDVSQYRELLERLRRLEQAPSAIDPEVTHYVGDAADAVAPSFANGWLNYDNGLARPTAGLRNAGFYRYRGRVYLAGVIKSGTVGQPVFTLPVGYRIATTLGIDFVVNSAAAFGLVRVDPSGAVTTVTGSNVYVFLDQVNFPHA